MKILILLAVALLPIANSQNTNGGLNIGAPTGSITIGGDGGLPTNGGLNLGGNPSGNLGGIPTNGVNLGGNGNNGRAGGDAGNNANANPGSNANPTSPNPSIPVGESSGFTVDPSGDTVVPGPGTPGQNGDANNNNNNNNNSGFGGINFPNLNFGSNFGDIGNNFPSLPTNTNFPGTNGDGNTNNNNARGNIPSLDFDFGSDFNFPSGPSGFPNTGGSGFPSGGIPGFPNSGSSGFPNSGSGGFPNSGSGGFPNSGSGGFPNSGSSGFPNSGSSGFPNSGSTGFPNSGSSGFPNSGSSGFPGGNRPGFPNGGVFINFPSFPGVGGSSTCQTPKEEETMVDDSPIPPAVGQAVIQEVTVRPELQYLISLFQAPEGLTQLPTESSTEYSCAANYSYVTKVTPSPGKECWVLQPTAQASVLFAKCQCANCQEGAVPGFGSSGMCKPQMTSYTLLAFCPTSNPPIEAVRVMVPTSCRCMRSNTRRTNANRPTGALNNPNNTTNNNTTTNNNNNNNNNGNNNPAITNTNNNSLIGGNRFPLRK